MSLLTSSIDLDTITPPTLEISQFPSIQIEQLANLFLQAGDTVRPILLRKISPISFQILEGHFEYYAAMKAQEIDEQFTAIRAYVVPPDLESTILAQYQFLRSLSSPAPVENIAPLNKSDNRELDLAKVEQAIAERLEQKLATTIDRIVEERISSSFQTFATQMTQQLSSQLLDLKQSLATSKPTPVSSREKTKDKPVESIDPASATSRAKTKDKSIKSIDNDNPKVLQVLNDFNTMNVADLEHKLSQLKPSKRSLARLIHAQRSFQSVEDVINNVAGIKEATMQKIIDAW